MVWRVTINPPEGSIVVLPNGRSYSTIFEMDSVGDFIEDSSGDPIEVFHIVTLTDEEFYAINPELLAGEVVVSYEEVPIAVTIEDSI